MTPTQYVGAFARFWWVVLGCALLGWHLHGTYLDSHPQLFRSTSTVVVGSTPVGRVNAAEATQSTALAQMRMATYASLATDPDFDAAVVKRAGSRVGPEQLSENLSTAVPTNSTVLQLAVIDDRPRRARLLARAAAEEMQVRINKYELTNGRRNALLEARISANPSSPAVPFGPPRWRNPLLILAASVLLGLALAVVAARTWPRVRDEDVTRRVTAAPVLGRFPWYASASGPVSLQRRRHARSLDVLTTALIAQLPVSGNHTVLVTSAGRARSLAALTDAVAGRLSAQGHRTLRVDADPSGASADRTAAGTGLGALLGGSSSIADVVEHEREGGYDRLDAGDLGEDPHHRLGSPGMSTFLEKASFDYDWVLVAAAPPTAGTSALAISAHTDGVLLALPRWTSPWRLRSTVRTLSRVDARLLGTVLLR